MLETIGLDTAAESAYRALIANSEWNLTDLAEHLGRSEPEVRRLLDRLAELSLVRTGEPDRPRPVSPELGLTRLLTQSRADLARRQKQIEEARIAIATMTDEYRATRAHEHAVSRLDGDDVVHDRLAELARGARRECLSFLPAGDPFGQLTVAGGAAVRGVCRESARNDPASVRSARRLVADGAEIRATPELPFRMTLVDSEVALVWRDSGVLEVRGEGLLAVLVALFEQTWAAAAPFTEPSGRGKDGLFPLDRALLRLLSQGCTDEIAAKRLGVSLRTVRRMTAALLDRLDARSRFQAGVRAAQRGWL